VTILLKPVEMLWRGLNRVRRTLYRRGVLKARRLPKPVISIGAITAGGAGKTPATIAIGEYLIGRGYRVAVLTRGYRRSGAGGRVTELDAAKFGDEPVLMKRKLGEVIVGSNRYENGLTVNCDVYLLDDGFQHLQLARDVDVVIDAPGKWLREGRAALRDADFVIPRRIEGAGGRGRGAVFAFAGLADNKQFFASLSNVVGTMSFPDHHRYTASDLERIRAAARAAGAESIVTTEKDAVKIPDGDIIAIAARFVIDAAVLEAIEARIRR
jgi:tetraacyldisaccharide 4'-kinase